MDGRRHPETGAPVVSYLNFAYAAHHFTLVNS
ncbi:hypothetical protein PF66_01354 [Pseudomonas asplenii]|uniref:Uncharacterized protein n=1 Tax=Pseudomonas asplenii TaxID=53407 RepID=A0A0M9GIJ1_9PSED|nr:hypothetical protein PF66_01354 [Pseudomonas fuscovaginae]